MHIDHRTMYNIDKYVVVGYNNNKKCKCGKGLIAGTQDRNRFSSSIPQSVSSIEFINPIITCCYIYMQGADLNNLY